MKVHVYLCRLPHGRFQNREGKQDTLLLGTPTGHCAEPWVYVRFSRFCASHSFFESRTNGVTCEGMKNSILTPSVAFEDDDDERS